jgi:hypothetical protein
MDMWKLLFPDDTDIPSPGWPSFHDELAPRLTDHVSQITNPVLRHTSF